MMNGIFATIGSVFFGKRKIIGWISAVGFVAGAAATQMSTEDFKTAVCGAPVVKAESK